MNLERIERITKNKLTNDDYIYRTECYVVFVDSYVVKLFQYAKDRNVAYTAQNRASKYGLGPGVYGKIKIGKLHGYISEKVYTLDADYDYVRLRKDWEKDMDILKNKLADVDIYFHDDHYRNVGWTKDAELVCIDFGAVSCDS